MEAAFCSALSASVCPVRLRRRASMSRISSTVASSSISRLRMAAFTISGSLRISLMSNIAVTVLYD